MKKQKKNIILVTKNERGATLIEIALYIALVVIVCVTVVTTLGDKLQSVFQAIVNSLG